MPSNTIVYLDQPQVHYVSTKRSKKPKRMVTASYRGTVRDLLRAGAMESHTPQFPCTINVTLSK